MYTPHYPEKTWEVQGLGLRLPELQHQDKPCGLSVPLFIFPLSRDHFNFGEVL